MQPLYIYLGEDVDVTASCKEQLSKLSVAI